METKYEDIIGRLKERCERTNDGNLADDLSEAILAITELVEDAKASVPNKPEPYRDLIGKAEDELKTSLYVGNYRNAKFLSQIIKNLATAQSFMAPAFWAQNHAV